MEQFTFNLWQRVAFMVGVAAVSAFTFAHVVFPLIGSWTGTGEYSVVSTEGASRKGDFEGWVAPKVQFKRHAGVQSDHNPEVGGKGDFLGWFPDTGNLELEFKVTQTEAPLQFPYPQYKAPQVVQPDPEVFEPAPDPDIHQRATTRLVAFASSPFPFFGRDPRSQRPFLTRHGNKTVRVTRSGRVYSAHKTYSDRRALIHIPKGFDIKSPGVMVVFYHGHGATLHRDVFKRQRVPQQITESGVNAVLVAPQFAFNARDSAAGKFWEPGGVKRFVDDVAKQLAQEHGAPGAERAFRKMPVVVVAYSGGFEPAAWTVSRGGLGSRLKGLVLLDALYGHMGRFAHWISRNRDAFLINAYAVGSPRRNSYTLKAMLRKQGIPYRSSLTSQLRPGSVTFLSAVTRHRDYVTRAWTRSPISDMLRRLRYLTGEPPQHMAAFTQRQ